MTLLIYLLLVEVASHVIVGLNVVPLYIMGGIMWIFHLIRK